MGNEVDVLRGEGSPTWHGIARIHLAGLLPNLPPHLRRVLVVGVGEGEVGLFLQGRDGVETYGLDGDEERLDRVRECFSNVVHGTPVTALPFPRPFFDALIVTDAFLENGDIEEALRALIPHLGPNGQAFLLLPNGAYGRLPGNHPARARLDLDLASIAAAKGGMRFYCQWSMMDTELRQTPLDETGHLLCGGRRVHVGDEAGHERCATLAWLIQLVQPGYDPLAHARALFGMGRPEWSYHLLINIPSDLPSPEASRVTINLETMLSLLAWRQKEGRDGLVAAFNRAQLYFHDTVAVQPDCVPVYQCMAQFWRILGDVDMSRRILRSIQTVVPDDPSLNAQLASLQALPSVSKPEVEAPAWSRETYRPRVLFVMHPRLHFGLDVLYDGLCEVLGDDYVTEYPYKPTLHGDTPREMAHYPCSFDRPGVELDLESILAKSRGGEFDLVLYGDCEAALDEAVARRISEAAGDTPFCIVDAIDESQSTRRAVCKHIGRSDVTAYFKREMLACEDYGPNAFPLPFAFAENRSDKTYSEYRPTRFFWAGHRQFSMRRLYLEYLERHLNVSLEGFFAPEDYNRILRESLIGLNCFGFGFDTVRFWELPARGCMLLSERLPIVIPHDFKDGESAVYWDDLPGLVEKLDYYLDHAEEAARIARAGHEHFWRHHTGAARARQLLGWVARLVNTDKASGPENS